MERKPIIVVNKNTPYVVEVFSTIGEVVPLDTDSVTSEAVHAADVLIVRSETKVDRDLLEGSSVRFVGTVTIGTDHVDRRFLAFEGIGFASAPGSNANSVAEYVAAALLDWSSRTGAPLAGKLLGIVGVGNTGSRVVRVASALGMKVILNDPPLALSTRDDRYRPLDELMGADFVSLHVPLTTNGEFPTYHLFDGVRIRKMKKGAILINTSRGGVVDGSGLRSALGAGHLSTAILDVWEEEPRVDTGLLEHVMIGTPHIAGYSLDGKINALRMVYGAACGFLGVRESWPSRLDVALDEGGLIDIPPSLIDIEAVLRQAVRHAYDIGEDDRNLRRISTLSAKDRGVVFRELRAGYRIRREFPNYTIRLTADQMEAQKALTELGFRTSTPPGT